jgi:hypothetical protein
MSKLVERLKGLGNLAVLAGIILIAVEINQNSKLVEAQLASDDAAAWVAIDASKQGENFADVLAKAIERPEDLTLAEMLEMDGYLFTYLDQLWRQEDLSTLGLSTELEPLVQASIDEFFGNEFAQAWWVESKFKFEGDDSELFEIVDREIQNLSPTQDLEYFGRIKSRIIEGE